MRKSGLNLGEMLVIILLRKNGNRHGFALKRSIDELGLLKMSQGGIYTILRRLESEKLVRGVWEEGRNSDGGRRRLYTLTDTGLEAYIKSRRIFADMLAG